MSKDAQVQVGVVEGYKAMFEQAVEIVGNGDDVENAFITIQKKDGTLVTLAEVDYPLTLTMLMVRQGVTELFQIKKDRAVAALPRQ